MLKVIVVPSATVNVALVAGAVIVTLFMLVAVATPSVGVTSVGLVARTMLPEPVDALPRAVTVPLVGNVRFVAPVNVNAAVKAPIV